MHRAVPCINSRPSGACCCDLAAATTVLYRSARARGRAAAVLYRRAWGNAAAPWLLLLPRSAEARARCRGVALRAAPNLAPNPGGLKRPVGRLSYNRNRRPCNCTARAIIFWALFGPVWPRRAPRGSRAPANCMSTQGRGSKSKQGPVFLSPAPLRPWQGPGRFRKQAATKAQF